MWPIRLPVASLGAALASVAILALSAPLCAQDAEVRRVTVPVRQVAGSNVYLDLGTDHGLAAGDTLAVAADSAGPVVGRLTVVAATAIRSVLTFAGAPFPLTRGAAVTLTLARPGRAPAPDAAPGPRAARGDEDDADRRSPPPRRPAYGRIALDMSTLHSVTTFGGTDPESVARTYATPALRLSATVPQAVAGFDLHTSMRLAYRYAEGGFPADAFSGRIYLASLERTFESVPLRMALGRFSGPTESFSGYWDGLHLRLGSPSLGIAVLVGFQPDLWNQGFSTALPKGSVVVDWRRSGSGWRWTGDVSAHAVRPTDDGVVDHTFLGMGQTLRAGPVRLDQELQMDRTPEGSWEVGRLRLRGSLRLAPGLDLRAGVSRRRYWSLLPLADPFGDPRDRATVGLSARSGRGYVSVDATGSRRDGGQETKGVTASGGTGSVASLGGVSLGARVSWWEGDRGHTLGASPSLAFDAGPARIRTAYRFYRSDYLERTTTRHDVDASARLPLGGGWSGHGRLGVAWGGGLRSERLDVGLARSF